MDAQFIRDIEELLAKIRVEDDDIDNRREADKLLNTLNAINQKIVEFYGYKITGFQKQEIFSHAIAGENIQAIKALRTATGDGLKETKKAIQRFMEDINRE